MDKIKTAVVGVGHLGKHHLKWLHQLPESELVGFYDIDEAKREKFADEYQTRAFESLEQLAEHAEAVSIVVPTTEHFAAASFLIERGIHCLIEKPVTASLEHARKLQTLAEAKGVKVAVGHIERFNPAVRAVSALGVKPSFIEAHRLAAFDPRGTDVAVVLDLMIHDIDLALLFVESSVADIHASAVAVVSEQVDIANARLTFENGAVANLTASRISLKEMRKLRIFQKSGYFSLDLARKQADIYRLKGESDESVGMKIPLGNSEKSLYYSRYDDTGEDMLRMELTAFLEAVREDKPVAVSLAEGTEALRVALEIERIGKDSIERMMGTETE